MSSNFLPAAYHKYSVKPHTGHCIPVWQINKYRRLSSEPSRFCVYLFTVHLLLRLRRRHSCRAEKEGPGGRGGYLSELLAPFTVQWLRLGSAEVEEGSWWGCECREYWRTVKRRRRLRREDSVGLIIKYRSREKKWGELPGASDTHTHARTQSVP